MQTIYTVSIAFAGSTAPNDGFIDNTTVNQYMALGAAAPTTYAASQAKSRANFRFKFLVQQLQAEGLMTVQEATAPAANCNTAATTFNFQAVYDHGNDATWTYDETSKPNILTGATAIARCVARALIETTTVEAAIYDPTTGTAPGNTTQANRIGPRVDQLVVGSIASNLTTASALVTVAQIV